MTLRRKLNIFFVTSRFGAALVVGLKAAMEDYRMSLSSHLTELQKKHAAIQSRIEQEQRSPGSSDLQIAAMKREKLKLKEEIERLSGRMH